MPVSSCLYICEYTLKDLVNSSILCFSVSWINIFYSILIVRVTNMLKFACDYQLSRRVVQNVHLSGGSLLGVSRGGPTISEIVDSMEVVHRSICFKELPMLRTHNIWHKVI